jgi:hypothetical protein
LKLHRSTNLTLTDLDERDSFIATDRVQPEWQVQATRVHIEISAEGMHILASGWTLRPGTGGLSSTVRTVIVADFDDLPTHIREYVTYALLDAQEGTY